MNIKDAYIHGTHGVVKNINVAIKESEPYDDSILYYTLADLNNTSHYVKLPLASATQNGLMSSLDKIKLNNFSSDIHSSGWYAINNPYTYNINGDESVHHHYIKIAKIDIMDYVLRFRIFENINFPSYGEWILRLNHASLYGKNVTLYQISPSTINLSLYIANSGDSSNPQYEVWIKSDIEWQSAIQFCIEKNLNNKNLVFTSNWEYSIEEPVNIIATLNNSGSIRIMTSNGQEVVQNNSNQSTYKSYLTSDFFVGNLKGNSDTSSVAKATAYGVCTTASDAVIKEVTIPSNQFGGLVEGSRVSVRFLSANTASDITLKVNESEAKPCNWNGYGISGLLKAYTVYDFIYDGTQWRLVGGVDTDTKNTAGSTNSDSKLFLIGATSQSANPQTYSHDTAYVGSNGFLYSNSKKVDMDLVVPLNAQGSRIPANADLNTIEYLKIGNYYCPYTSDAGTIKNCPVSEAFRMEVYSILEQTPNESAPWANRLRKLTTVVGEQYIQHCYNSNNTEFTYKDWIYVPTVKAIIDSDTNGSIIKVGDSATPVYINTKGNFEACTNVQSDISKAVAVSTRITSQEELDAFIEAGKVKFAILGASAELPKPILNGKDGLIVSHGWVDTSNYGYQMAYDDGGYNISFRYYNYGTWSDWKALTFEGHTHNYAGSDSVGGPANEVKISPGSSNLERNVVVASGNSLFTVPNVTGNYSAGTLTANYFKFKKWDIKHPEDNSNFWQAIFGETLPTGLTTVKPFRFDLSGGASPTTVSYNNNTVQLYNNYAASLIWTTWDTFGYLNIPAYPREMDNVWIGGGNNNNANGWSAKLFHSRKNLIPQENDIYDVGSSEYKWKDVYASTFIGNLDGYYVNKLTGYTETKSDAKITAADTLNTALSKLEHKADLAYKWVSSVTAETDTDEYVNKWDEIVDFLDSVKEGSDISTSFVTTATTQTITGLKTFQTKSTEDNKQAVALKLKNDGWLVDMSTAVDFYNGSMYTVPNARIETKMNGPGYRGGTLIFSTQSREANAQNPNPNPLTERLRITDDGNSVFNTHILPSVTGTYDFGSSNYSWKDIYATTLYEDGKSLADKYAAKNHTHTFLTGAGMQPSATTRNLTNFPASKTLFTGCWTSAGGYATNYGTTLDISYSTWYQRLAFNTAGRIEYFRGINTDNSDKTEATLTKVGDLAYTHEVFISNRLGESGLTATDLKAYADLSESVKDQEAFKVLNSGSYSVNYEGHTGLLINLSANYKFASASALEFLINYRDEDRLKVRKIIDSNRVSGGFKELAWYSDIPTTLKNPYSLTIQGNGTTLTNGVYDGSSAKTVNITPVSIGALSLSGGTISSSSFCPLVIERSGSTNMAAIRFQNDSGVLGSIGMNTIYGSLLLHNADGTASKIILDSVNYSNYALPLRGGTMTGAIDLTNSPNIEDGYKMGLRLLGSDSGGIHFNRSSNYGNDYGNAITWGYSSNDVSAAAGIYVKTSGSYGSKMYLATTNLFNDGPKAALEIDQSGNITALRSKFIGNLTGSSTTTGDGTIILYAEKNNEINFGGTAVSDIIYFGYRAKDSKTTIPSKFVFGSTTGTAEVVAKTFKGNLTGNVTGTAATAASLGNGHSTTTSRSKLTYLSGQYTNNATETADQIYLGSSANWDVISSPVKDGTDALCNIMSMRMAFNASFWHEIAATPNTNMLYHRNVSSNGAVNWKTILDSDNYSNYALSLSGGRLSTASSTILALNNNSENAPESGLRFEFNQTSKGWVGYQINLGTYLYTYNGPHKLGIKDDGTGFIDSNTIIHSGNYNNYALPLSGGTMTGTIASQTIRPITTNTYNLGSVDYKWKNIYATIFDGAIRSKDIRLLDGITSDFERCTFTPIFSNVTMPTTNWWSGFTSKGWDNEYNSWQLVAFSGLGDGSALDINWRSGVNDTWNNWKRILDNSNTTYTESTTNSIPGSYVIGTLKIGGTDHVLYGKDTSSVSLSNTIKTNAKYTVSTSSWANTGYTFESLDAGTYVIQLISDNLIASGIMSVLKNVVDTMGDEIPLHVYGTAGWRPYLRTRENKLQIASNDVSNTERTVTIKIARIL